MMRYSPLYERDPETASRRPGGAFGDLIDDLVWRLDREMSALKDQEVGTSSTRRRAERLARDISRGLRERDIHRIDHTGPQWVSDWIGYGQSHSPHDPTVGARTGIFHALGCVGESLANDRWDEEHARTFICAHPSPMRDHDMPRYEAWELPPPSEVLRTLEVDAYDQFADLVGDLHSEAQNREALIGAWEDAIREAVPSASPSNYAAYKAIYEADQKIIDYHADPPNMNECESLFDHNVQFIASGVIGWLEDRYDEAVDILMGGQPAERCVSVRFRPDGFDVVSIRPVRPL
jgi:hypothetical protein